LTTYLGCKVFIVSKQKPKPFSEFCFDTLTRFFAIPTAIFSRKSFIYLYQIPPLNVKKKHKKFANFTKILQKQAVFPPAEQKTAI